MKVLLIEDHEGFALIVREMLRSTEVDPVAFEWVSRLNQAVNLLSQSLPDVILVDLALPDSQGLDTLSRLLPHAGPTPIIVLTGTNDENLAIQAISHGAQDYLLKGDIDRRGFVRAIRYAVERKKSELRLGRHRERQNVLHEINVAITSTLNLQSVLHALLDKIGKLLPKLAVTFWRPVNDLGDWEAVVCWNMDDKDWRPFWKGSPSGLVKAVIEAGIPVVIEDLANDSRASNPEMIHHNNLVAYVGVPLQFKDELLGIIGFFSRERAQLNSEEVEFLTTLAGHVAMAVYNARAYERAQLQATRLENANQEIRAAQNRYTELIGTIHAIVWEADPVTWQFTFVSRAAEEILAYPVERWLHTPDFWAKHLLHPDDREDTIRRCQTEIVHGSDHELEYRAVGADGRIVWLRDTVRVITDETGKPIRLRGVMIDVTKSREAEEKLQKHSLEIRSLQEISQKVLNSADVRDAIEKILDMAVDLGGYDIGSIRLLSPANGYNHVILRGFHDPESMRAMLNHRVARPQDERWRNQARVISTRETHVFEDIEIHEGFPVFKREGIRSVIILPIAMNDEAIGVLQVGNRRTTNFQPDHVKFLETLASQIGIVLQKAKLYEEIRAHLSHMGAMRQFEQALVSTLSMDDVIKVLLDRIEAIVPVPAALAVQLLNSTTSDFDVLACRNIDTEDWRREHAVHLSHRRSGLAQAVLSSPTPVQILRLGDDSRVRHREFNLAHGLVSYLGIALRVAEKPVGVLDIMTKTAHDFTDQEVNYVAALAAHAAIAIQNARLYAELAKKSQELSGLFAITATASHSLDMQTILQEVVQKISEIFGFDATRVFLFDDQNKMLYARASYVALPGISLGPSSFDRGEGISGAVAATGEAIIFSNVATDALYTRMSHSKHAKFVGRKFLAGFPVKHKDVTLGVIMCTGKNARELTAHEIQLINSMSNQIAIAIHNARLYAEVEKQSKELSALFEVTSAASQSLETDQILREVAQKITEIFSFDATRVFLLDDAKGELHAQATYETHLDFAPSATRLKMGKGISGVVVATGTAIIISDTSTDPRYLELTTTKSALKAEQKFLASFPIKYKEQTLGAITCVGRQPRQLAGHEIQLINSMSSQIAVALENSRYYEQTKKQALQLRNYAARQESVREQERSRISREIHDVLGQSLTALKLEMSLLGTKLRNGDAEFEARFREISQLLDGTIQTVRKIATQLRPDVLDKLGLIPAVEWQIQEFRRRTGLVCQIASYPDDIQLNEAQATAFFRILQEAMTNVARHAHATRVHVRLEQRENHVILSVVDNGVGIDAARLADPGSLGLLGMRERAVALGGSVTVDRNPGSGTTVTACIPVKGRKTRREPAVRIDAV